MAGREDEAEAREGLEHREVQASSREPTVPALNPVLPVLRGGGTQIGRASCRERV